jgi:hypothetical protein
MILRDLTPFELKYLDRDTLAERVDKLQTECASLRNQVEQLTAQMPAPEATGWTYDRANPQDCSHRDDPAHDHDQCLEQMAADRPDAPDNDEPSYPMFGTHSQKQSVLSRLPETPDRATGGNRGY